MNTIKSTIYTEAIFSDDEQHRYLLKKIWDEKKPVCTVITMYPHLDGVLSLDLTTSLNMASVVLLIVFIYIITSFSILLAKASYNKKCLRHLLG
ncbi:hypothetical protein BUZ54_03685 [Staphylococcus hominis]|nr:hypothetical protein BUZ54_03685 [Staphylococcus hominis]